VAQVIETNQDLVLVLSWLEQVGALHKSIRVPKSSLDSVKEVENPWSGPDGMKGFRAPGTGIPGVVMLGTLRGSRGKDFAAVYGKGRAKVYEFSSGPFRRWILSESKL